MTEKKQRNIDKDRYRINLEVVIPVERCEYYNVDVLDQEKILGFLGRFANGGLVTVTADGDRITITEIPAGVHSDDVP